MTTDQIAKLIKSNYGLKIVHNIEKEYGDKAIYYYGENKEGIFSMFMEDHIFSLELTKTYIKVLYEISQGNFQVETFSIKDITQELLIKKLNDIFYVKNNSPLRLRRDYILSQLLMD